MNFLRSLSCIPPRSKPGRPFALSASIFKNVPMELVVSILDHLSIESAVAFTLTCKHLKDRLGTQWLEKLRLSPPSIPALLELIALDLPDQIACAPCNRLHGMKTLLAHNTQTLALGPFCVTVHQAPSRLVLFDPFRLLTTAAIDMVLKKHNQQADGAKDTKKKNKNKLLAKISKNIPTMIMTFSPYMWHCQGNYQITNGHLFLRFQHVLLPLAALDRTHPEAFYNGPLHQVCPHIDIQWNVCEPTGGIRRCTKCRTEYRLDFKSYGARGNVVFFSKWKDLGTGPAHDVWREHLADATFDIYGVRVRMSDPGIVNPPGFKGIAACFGDDAADFDAFFSWKSRYSLFAIHDYYLKWPQGLLLLDS